MRYSSFVAIALSFTSALAFQCTRQYTVVSGDICDSICQNEGVSLSQFMALNPTVNEGCTNLMPNSIMCLSAQGQDCKQVYTVVPNDTCEKVASAYGIDLQTFYYNNPLLNSENCDNLYIDEVVCVGHDRITYNNQNGTPSPIPMPSTALPATPTDLPWCD